MPHPGARRRGWPPSRTTGTAPSSATSRACGPGTDAVAPADRFGRDGDVLADSLSDHTVRLEGAVERGPLIVVRGRRAYAAARSAEWATARDVFAETAGLTPPPSWPRPLEDPPSRALTSLDDPPGDGAPVDMGQ
ncbi:barstar family protein [Streptomyces sp. NPDC044984]|uniref:barstar family protein n=1 Tax=Streptomyces sp. NPDC044984 TaxID=3154335 RepID=UPI0033C73B47